MQKKFITIARENRNADFYLVCHAACEELGNFQWFLKDEPNSEHEVNLENQVYESFSTDSNWIKENAENLQNKIVTAKIIGEEGIDLIGKLEEVY